MKKLSCVTSETFEHKEQKTGTDNGEDFNYNTSQSLTTYGLDNEFYVHGKYYSALQGSVSTSIVLSVSEAKKLKKQLDEFIKQNS